MLLIESLQQYKQITARAKQLPDVLTNCYLLPSKVEALTRQGRLYAVEKENLTLLLERAKGFFRVYYYLSPLCSYEPLMLELPAVIEFVFNGALSKRQRREIQLLEDLGFSLGRESARMSLEAGAAQRRFESGETSVAKAEEADMILGLLCRYFNPLYAFIPEKEELLDAIEQGAVFVVRQVSRPEAILFAESVRSTATIRQLLVSEKARSRGYAKNLVETYHEKYREKVRSFFHWVDVNNSPAVRLYQSFGYSFDGRKANEYVLQKKEI